MEVLPSLLCLFLLVSSIAIGFRISRTLRDSRVGARVPLFLELPLILFLFSVALLPQALPTAFEYVLGHSITANYEYLGEANVRITETWVLARWWTPLRWVFALSVVIGLVWAVWNLSQKRDSGPNVLALCLGGFWMILVIGASLLSLPFGI